MTGESEPERQWAQYHVLVDEYRFQVELNWKRSQYFFVLNLAVLVAGVGLLSASTPAPRGLIAGVFAVGALFAGLSIAANRTQRGYYRAARERMQRAADRLELGDAAIATTPGLGSEAPRKVSVTTLLEVMLTFLAIIDLAGVVAALA